MKMGRPEYYILSLTNISCDIRKVFTNTQKHTAKMLQEHNGALNFTTDMWTSPNHRAYVAVTIHFKKDGVPRCMILNIVEVAMLYSGINLAAAFTQILEEFSMSDKVSFLSKSM
jgi:hypothetical protein